MSNTRLQYTFEQKDQLIEYLKRTEKYWSFVVRDDDLTTNFYEFPVGKIDSYNPDYKKIKEQIEKMEILNETNRAGFLPISRIKFVDILPLVANSFWGILKDITTFNFYNDMFTINNRCFAIAIVALFLWIFI
jgi:hypothetical protein